MKSLRRLPLCKLVLTLAIIALAMGSAFAAPLDNSNPTVFFNTLAARLLKAEMNLDLTRLQIWPTNQYTPAVHRLLQVTANIYDASTNRFNDVYPHLPTVFRPRFTNENGIVYITDYREVTNYSELQGLIRRDLVNSLIAANVQPDDLIFGFPLILGAKKGLPNFNEFSSETVIQITRKAEVRRSIAGGYINETNQMFIIGISNAFGVEFWNSYVQTFQRPVEILATNFYTVSLTNDFGFAYTTNLIVGSVSNMVTWAGWKQNVTLPPTNGPWSFAVPMLTNHIVIPDLAYRHSTASFDGVTNVFERPQPAQSWFPQWVIAVTNRLLAIIKEPGPNGRIVDYVHLTGLSYSRNLMLEIAEDPYKSDPNTAAGLWATNSPDGIHLSDYPGLRKQIEDISLGAARNLETIWNNNVATVPSLASMYQAIANFRSFMTGIKTWTAPGGFTYTGTNSTADLIATVPFSPTVKWSIPMIWQARDPLVHYLSQDLRYLEKSGVRVPWTPPSGIQKTLVNLWRLNNRFQPWGGNLNSSPDPSDYNLALKDPGVTRSDAWPYPDAEPLSIPMLARVHRGTPWQSLYLKSSADVSLDALSTWGKWIGNQNLSDARHAHPSHDWPLIALIASLINTNPPQTLLSINNPDTNAWLAAFDSISVLTNITSNDELIDNGGSGQFDTLTMSFNSSQAALLENAIRSARAAQPNGYFRDIGDLLSISALSVASPWLNLSSQVQLEDGLHDVAYEAIPAQLLSRVRADSIGTALPDRLQFTGYDDYPYAIEASANLTDWTPISTNWPTNGVFEIVLPPNAETHFFRSRLLP